MNPKPSGNLTWQDAKRIARKHVAGLQLPEAMDGVPVHLADYHDEEALRFLKSEEPNITLQSQRMINQAFARELRKRGARVGFVPVRVKDYFAWLEKFSLADSQANRAQYVGWLLAPEPKPAVVR